MDLVRIGNLLDTRRDGHCLPGGLYNDPQVFDFDLQVMYGTSWLMAGFTCELPKPGSYVALMIGKWPVIIIRDRNNVIRAFITAAATADRSCASRAVDRGPSLSAPITGGPMISMARCLRPTVWPMTLTRAPTV